MEAISAPPNEPLGVRDLYVAAFLDEVPVGCGALREYDHTTAQMRRIFVRAEHRRKHVARTIVAHLVAGARELGYGRIMIETGDRQAPAMALYGGFGFQSIEPFGEHRQDATSRCYELRIGKDGRGPATG